MLRRDGVARPILGFGCSTSRDLALESARWELLERVLMCADVSGDPHRNVPGIGPDGAALVKPFVEVVARPWHDEFRHGNDATGIAVRDTYEGAAMAARCEVVERAALAELWYGTTPVPSPQLIGEPGPELRTFTWRLLSVWFSLAVFARPAQEVLVCGSAVADTAGRSQEHAVEEAVMVTDSVVAGHISHYQQTDKADRYASLMGAASTSRLAHLELRLATARDGGALVDEGAVADSISVFHLIDRPQLHLVRAVSDAGSPLAVRRRSGVSTPDDPFV